MLGDAISIFRLSASVSMFRLSFVMSQDSRPSTVLWFRFRAALLSTSPLKRSHAQQ